MTGETVLGQQEAQAMVEEGRFIHAGLKTAIQNLRGWEDRVGSYLEAQGYEGGEVPEGLEGLHGIWVKLPEAGEVEGLIYGQD